MEAVLAIAAAYALALLGISIGLEQRRRERARAAYAAIQDAFQAQDRAIGELQRTLRESQSMIDDHLAGDEGTVQGPSPRVFVSYSIDNTAWVEALKARVGVWPEGVRATDALAWRESPAVGSYAIHVTIKPGTNVGTEPVHIVSHPADKGAISAVPTSRHTNAVVSRDTSWRKGSVGQPWTGAGRGRRLRSPGRKKLRQPA